MKESTLIKATDDALRLTRNPVTVEDMQKSFPWVNGKALHILCKSIHEGGCTVAFHSPSKKDMIWYSETPATAPRTQYILKDFEDVKKSFETFNPAFSGMLRAMPELERRKILFNGAMGVLLMEFEKKFREKCAMPLFNVPRNKVVKSRMLHPKAVLDICNAHMGVLGLDTNVVIFNMDKMGMVSGVATYLWQVQCYEGTHYIPAIFE